YPTHASSPHLTSFPTRRSSDLNAMNIDADLVHCHTWYSHVGGILAKKNYGLPLVITVHSLEPLRPWKREQLGGGYDFSLWVEKTDRKSTRLNSSHRTISYAVFC